MTRTCPGVVAGLVHFALEELQAHNGVDGNQQEDQQGDVQQGQHGFQNGVHHHLQAWRKNSETKASVRKKNNDFFIN